MELVSYSIPVLKSLKANPDPNPNQGFNLKVTPGSGSKFWIPVPGFIPL